MAENRNLSCLSRCRRFISWIQSWIRLFCCAVLKTGVIPTHVAFIMDGNRRYAEKVKKNRIHGHSQGFSKLTEVLVWCRDLGIKEVTVYAFSIANFQRSDEEVSSLMELAKQKITHLLEQSDLIHKHGICIRVLGDLHMLRKDVLEAIAKVVFHTQHYDNVILNVCFAYTSRAEITDTVMRLIRGSADGSIYPSDVSEELIERCLYTGDSPPPDLLIRTSGEVRLSDFLCWQCAYSCLCFQKTLWPEYSIWNFFSAIITYQRNFKPIQKAKEYMLAKRKKRQYESDMECVLKEEDNLSEFELERRIQVYAYNRKKRTEKFITAVRRTRMEFLAQFKQ